MILGTRVLGCCPARRREKKNEECREEMNYWSVKYNEGLISMLQELNSELKGIYYSFSDSYEVFLDLIQRPTAYGITDYFLFIN